MKPEHPNLSTSALNPRCSLIADANAHKPEPTSNWPSSDFSDVLQTSKSILAVFPMRGRFHFYCSSAGNGFRWKIETVHKANCAVPGMPCYILEVDNQ
jgi:hypothetical protein